jgi:uncharacterized protein with HEPN domain
VSRDVRLSLYDVTESCDKILRYTEGFNYEDFQADGKTFDAVVRNLEIIGEAGGSCETPSRTRPTGARSGSTCGAGERRCGWRWRTRGSG